MSEAPFCESHCMLLRNPHSRLPLLTLSLAGLTYCAIGALTFLGRLSNNIKPVPLLTPGTEEFELLARWLVARQTSDLGETVDEEQPNRPDEAQKHLPGAIQGLRIDDMVDALPSLEPPTEETLQWAGFNGRCNKVADTCYSFWNTATLVVSCRPWLRGFGRLMN